MALGLLACRWAWRLRDPAVRRATPLVGPVLAFSAATVLSALASGAPLASLASAKGLWLALALFVAADALPGPAAARRFLSGLTLVAAAAALLGLVQVAVCPGQAPDYGWPGLLYHRCHRARGFFSIYMTLAGVLLMVLLAELPRPPWGARRPGPLAAWLVMVGGLVATFTRGAWLGFGAGALALVPVLRRGRLVVVAGLVLLVVVALAGPYELRHRVQAMADPSEQGVRERFFMWQSGVAMWRAHPWLGVGPGGVKRRYADFASPDAAKRHTGHVHSAPLQVLVERGAVGFAAWLWIWVAFFVRAGRGLRRLDAAAPARALALGGLAAVTGFLVAGLSEHNFGDAEVVLVAWTLMGLTFAAVRGAAAPAQ